MAKGICHQSRTTQSPTGNFGFRRRSLLCLSQASHWVRLREPAQNTIDNSQAEDKVWVLFHLSSYRLMNSKNSSPRPWRAILFCASCKLNALHRLVFSGLHIMGRNSRRRPESKTPTPEMSPTLSRSEPWYCCPHLSIMSNSRNDTAMHYYKVRLNKIHPPFSYDSGLESKTKSQFWRGSMLRTLPHVRERLFATWSCTSRKETHFWNERYLCMKRASCLSSFMTIFAGSSGKTRSAEQRRVSCGLQREFERLFLSLTISRTLSGSKHSPAVRVYQIRGTILWCILEESTRTLWCPYNPME